MRASQNESSFPFATIYSGPNWPTVSFRSCGTQDFCSINRGSTVWISMFFLPSLVVLIIFFPQQVFMHPDQQSWMCCFFLNVFFQVFFSDSTFVNHREFHHHWGDYFLELVPSPSKMFQIQTMSFKPRNFSPARILRIHGAGIFTYKFSVQINQIY